MYNFEIFIYLFIGVIITSLLPFLSSFKTHLATYPLCSLARSWPLWRTGARTCVYVPKYINETCSVPIMFLVYFSGLTIWYWLDSRLVHLVLDNPLVLSSLGKSFLPSRRSLVTRGSSSRFESSWIFAPSLLAQMWEFHFNHKCIFTYRFLCITDIFGSLITWFLRTFP